MKASTTENQFQTSFQHQNPVGKKPVLIRAFFVKK